MSLEEYLMSAWKDYASIDKETCGIKKRSMPLVYHGDINKYRESVLRIVTADLTPPNDEFPEYNPSLRYKELFDYSQKQALGKHEATQLLTSLNSYFTRNSNRWFDHYEPLLNGLNASHTHILSPLSFDQKIPDCIDGSPNKDMEDLIKKGHSQWLQLMDMLLPDILITSLGDKIRENINSLQDLDWMRIENITTNTNGDKRRKPYQLQCAIVRFGGNRKCLLVFGDKSAVPFMVSQEQKLQIGAKLFRLMSNIYHERKPRHFQAPRETPVAETQKYY